MTNLSTLPVKNQVKLVKIHDFIQIKKTIT